MFAYRSLWPQAFAVLLAYQGADTQVVDLQGKLGRLHRP